MSDQPRDWLILSTGEIPALFLEWMTGDPGFTTRDIDDAARFTKDDAFATIDGHHQPVHESALALVHIERIVRNYGCTIKVLREASLKLIETAKGII